MPAIYCHSCQAQFSVPQNEGVCPNCGGGFVEEVAQARPAAAGPATGSGTYSARSFTLPGGMGNVRIVTSTGGALPPGFGGGFGGPGMGGDPFVNSVLEALLGGGFVHPGAGAGPFAGMPMPAMGGGMAQEQEWLDQVMSRIMNEYQPPSQAAAQRAVRSLPKLTVRAKDAAGEPGEGEALARAGEPCSVCHDEYREGEEVLELPCGHNYHADCLLPWLETHNTCPVCRHELPAEDPQVEAERRRRAQQAPGSASSSRRQRPGEQAGGGGRLADLLAGISSRWESFRDSMARPDEAAGQDHASPSAGERVSASGSASADANAGAGRPAAQAQQAAAHAQQAAAAQAGSSGRFGTAGSSGRAGVEADGGASAASASARPAPASSTDGLRQRRESAAAAAERRLRGDSATSLPSHPSQPTPPPARPAPPAGAARPAMPPHPAASRVQQQPPAVEEEEEREEGGEGVVAGALLGGALGAVLGGALMLLGRRGQRDRN